MFDKTVSEGEGHGATDVAFHDAGIISFVHKEVSLQSTRFGERTFTARKNAGMARLFGENSSFETGSDALNAGAVFRFLDWSFPLLCFADT